MNLHLRFLVLLWCCLLGGTASAQTFWSDNFEDTGSPSTGSRTTSVSEFKCTSGFFKRTDGTDKTWTGFGGGTGDFTGYTNSKYFAAMDVDRGPACGAQNAISAAQSITWSNIDISGKSGLTFKGRFGANTGAVFQGIYFNNSTNGFAMDYILVEYRLNGTGGWNKVLGIYPNDGSANGGPMAVDTNNDQIGDGTVLVNAMQELSADITATGSSLDLRVSLFVNNGNPGVLAFDDFRLSGAACTAPSITGNPVNRSVCLGSSTTFSATATGATGYKWQVDVNASGNYTDISNGGVYSTATTGTLTITGATAAMNGYRYRAVAMNGSATCATNSGYGTLSVSNMSATTAKTDVLCYGTATGSASVTAVTGNIGSVSYSWSPSGGTGASATGLAAGDYTVTITDLAGCSITRDFTIGQPSAALSGSIAKTDVSCFGGSNGTATVVATGGTTPYTYSWTGGGGTNATATGLSAGSYTVTVTDNKGCTITRSVTVGQPSAALSLATGGGKTDVSCFGGDNGTATVAPTGGTAPYTYSWSPSGGTGATASGLSIGTYTVTVTDFNGCQATRSFTIGQPAAALGGTISKTDVSCFGGSNGTATVVATGGTTPYSYSWTGGGGTNATATGLSAGSYTVTVTDNKGCTMTRSVTLGQPSAALSLATGGGKTDVSCFGGGNGTATVAPVGGTAPYTYSWSPSGGTGATASGLSIGTYTVTVTDFNGCQATRSFTIGQPSAALGGSIAKTDVSCFGGSNGTATVVATGGTTPYSYSWTGGGGTSATATGLSAGSYTVTVTDNKGCTVDRSVTVGEPSAALSLLNWSKTDVLCRGGSNGSAAVAPTGGTAPYTYAWTGGGGTAATASGLSAGTYTVTVTDNRGCQATRSFTINQPGSTVSLAYTGSTSISKGTAFSYGFSAAGGTPGYSYSATGTLPTGLALSGTGVLSGTPTVEGTFNFSVTASDANGCTVSVPVGITVLATLPVGMVDFNAKLVSGGVSLNWQTSYEDNATRFELWHKAEDGDFSRLTTLPATGNRGEGKRYGYLHGRPALGNNYYQLFQFDRDGTRADLGLKVVLFNGAANDEVLLYPNPAAHVVTLKFSAGTYVKLEVVDMLGKVLLGQRIAVGDTERSMNIDGLPRGSYTVILYTADRRSVHKLIKL